MVSTSPFKPGSVDTVTVTSTIESFTTPFDVAPGATADLTTAVGYLTNPANLVNSTHYDPFGPTFPTVGLTIDGALGLAAAKTADPTLAMITTWVAHNADSWTGIETSTFPPSGGALGKEALLAEVVGRDPHNFGGHDLIAAIDQAVCTGVSATCVAAGNYTDSSSVFDQTLGVLAQLRAGDTTNAASPVAYLESLQKGNGAWSGAIPASTTTTVDSTAMAVMALDLTSSTTAQLAVQSGLDWIVTQQQGDGGFTGASGISTNSTALAVMALGTSTFYATQIAAAQTFLAAEQNPDGGFTTAVGTATGSNLRGSTQAVNGLAGASFGTLSDPLTGPTPPAPPTGSTTANGGSSSTPTGTATAALPARDNGGSFPGGGQRHRSRGAHGGEVRRQPGERRRLRRHRRVLRRRPGRREHLLVGGDHRLHTGRRRSVTHLVERHCLGPLQRAGLRHHHWLRHGHRVRHDVAHAGPADRDPGGAVVESHLLASARTAVQPDITVQPDAGADPDVSRHAVDHERLLGGRVGRRPLRLR